MNVESLERETTRVATFTFPNSVTFAFGISSANSRSCSAVGFQTTDFGSTGSVLACRVRDEGRVEGLAAFVRNTSLMQDSSSFENYGSGGSDARFRPILHRGATSCPGTT